MFLNYAIAALAGKRREKVNTPDLSAADPQLPPNTSSPSIVWQSDGDILRNDALFDEWLIFGSGPDYQLFVTGTGDTPTGSGALDTWQTMNFDIGYTLQQNGVGSKSFTGTYQIRITASGSVIGSGTLNLNAVVSS